MGKVVRLDTFKQVLRHADVWEAHAHRIEALLLLATAQRDASDLLLRLAEDEILRLRGLIA